MLYFINDYTFFFVPVQHIFSLRLRRVSAIKVKYRKLIGTVEENSILDIIYRSIWYITASTIVRAVLL